MKIKLFFAALISVCTAANAQNTYPSTGTPLISSGANPSITIKDSRAGNNWNYIEWLFSNGTRDWLLGRNQNNGMFSIYREGLNEVFTIDNSGRVGIGKTNPQAALDVNGDVYSSARMNFTSANAYNGGNHAVLGLMTGVAGKNFVFYNYDGPVNELMVINGSTGTTSINNGGLNVKGNLGFGYSNPVNARMALRQTLSSQGMVISNCDIVGAQSHLAFTTADQASINLSAESYLNLYNDGKWMWNSSKTSSGTVLPMSFGFNGVASLFLKPDGNIGVGTSSPDQKLTVNGKIHSKEVIIDLSIPAPDYVFEKSYDLKSLDELKKYIEVNKHLPEIPSAKEMEKDGVKVGEMEMILLKKIEELTLYVLELKDEINKLKKQ